MKKHSRTQQRAQAFQQLFLSNYPTRSRFAEAYRTLRTNIHLSFMEQGFHRLLITSVGEKEGKTLTVANLAFTIAQAGQRVLMIDADLRKPFLSRLQPDAHSPGLTGILSGLFGTDIRSGVLGEMSVGDLAALASLQKRTGILEVANGSEQVRLLFRQGVLVDCEWLTCPKEKSMAAILVRHGKISQQQADLALKRQAETGQRLSTVLVNMGMLSPEQVSGLVQNHLAECLHVLADMSEGSFSFKDSPLHSSQSTQRYSLDVMALFESTMEDREMHPYIRSRIEAALEDGGEANLRLLPSGPMPPNPSELLGSHRMRFLLDKVRDIFDVVLLDTPPILPATDAVILAPLVDGVVFIVKEGHMNRSMVAKAVEQLRRSKANILGVVLNQVDVHRGSYYYKYYQKYYTKYYWSEDSAEAGEISGPAA